MPGVHTHHRLALSLAQALVEYSSAPLILLDGELRVLSASASFCDDFDIDCATVDGTPLLEVGGGEWNLPELRSFLEAGASGAAPIETHEMDFEARNGGLRHLVLNAQKLDHVGIESTRLLLAIADVTDARDAERLKDDLLRDKAVQLREVQHRVGNSLQIIASVLLQRVRTVQSEETRGHLRDAHQRVMSVAALQKQLAASATGDVAMKPYLEKVCTSIAASLIHDPGLLQLKVDADESTATPEASASIGLIATELVINAVKHAFPTGVGQIVVAFQTDGDRWTLSVRDNGVGLPPDEARQKIGLGTSIVQALANQLKASVNRTQLTPGTKVSIIHA
jgi:two-component sensor histidine kinase